MPPSVSPAESIAMSFEQSVIDELISEGVITPEDVPSLPTAEELAQAYEACGKELTQQAIDCIDELSAIAHTEPYEVSRTRADALLVQWHSLNEAATSWCRLTASDLREGNTSADMDTIESAFETYMGDLEKVVNLRRGEKGFQTMLGVKIDLDVGVKFEQVFVKLPERCRTPSFDNPNVPAGASLN
jgi:hypothetical protein